jgi:hypothetical protein
VELDIKQKELQYFIWNDQLGACYAHPRPDVEKRCFDDLIRELNNLRSDGVEAIFPDERAEKDSKEYFAYMLADTMLCSILGLPCPAHDLDTNKSNLFSAVENNCTY